MVAVARPGLLYVSCWRHISLQPTKKPIIIIIIIVTIIITVVIF